VQEMSCAADMPDELADRIAALRLALSGNLEKLTESRQQLRETQMSGRTGRSERQMLHDQAYARLLARLETMPVIEQAKGILMAQSRCSADEAFAMLRAASQRSNMKVRDLAADIVARVSGGAAPQIQSAGAIQSEAGEPVG
jgi:AmiR/NasT family two-component response regulator